MKDDKDAPQSGVRGIRWSKPHGKWIVKTTVDGCDVYRGLYADLDEAKRVLAAMRLELGDVHGRGHDDTTAHIPDAEIAEQFELHDDDEAVWRERPLVGDERAVRNTARWNSRYAGKKLAPRVKYERVGLSRHMWRNDIIARLAAIRDNPIPDAAEPAVSSGCKQGDGIPQDDATPPETYEDALAKALDAKSALDATLASDLAADARAKALDELAALAKPLEGLIIPPDPIMKGPLALIAMAIRREHELDQDDIMVLSRSKDPFEQDTPQGHLLGRWLLVKLDFFAPRRVIHLRGVHYLLVATQSLKPDGARYQNTKADYFWLNDRASKAARWLRYVDFERIVDERNEEAVIARAPRARTPSSVAIVLTGYNNNNVMLPEPLAVHRAKLNAGLVHFQPEQRYAFAVFGEKSSLNEVLAPFARRHGADLYIAVGELSERRAYEMARDAAKDGLFTFSDFDPSGYQMPVSIGVKLMAQRALQFPEFEFAVHPVALTIDDVVRLRLPTAMVAKDDKRVGWWQEAFAPRLLAAGLLTQADLDGGGLAQVEIDALAAINPAELERMAEAAIAQYLDPTLAERAAEANIAWAREAQVALDQGVDQARLDMLSHAERVAANRFNRALRSLGRTKGRIDAIEEAMGALARSVTLPPMPELPEADESVGVVEALVDSDWGYLDMVRAMQDRKAYGSARKLRRTWRKRKVAARKRAVSSE